MTETLENFLCLINIIFIARREEKNLHLQPRNSRSSKNGSHEKSQELKVMGQNKLSKIRRQYLSLASLPIYSRREKNFPQRKSVQKCTRF